MKHWSSRGGPFRLLDIYHAAVAAKHNRRLKPWLDQNAVSERSLTAAEQKVQDLEDKLEDYLLVDDPDTKDFDRFVKAFTWGTWDNRVLQRRPQQTSVMAEDGLEFTVPKWEAAHEVFESSNRVPAVALTRVEKEGFRSKVRTTHQHDP